MTTPRQVQAALTSAAAKFKRDTGRLGILEFGDVCPSADEPGCNWTAAPFVRGGPTTLTEMREIRRKVQARYPVVEWPD